MRPGVRYTMGFTMDFTMGFRLGFTMGFRLGFTMRYTMGYTSVLEPREMAVIFRPLRIKKKE